MRVRRTLAASLGLASFLPFWYCRRVNRCCHRLGFVVGCRGCVECVCVLSSLLFVCLRLDCEAAVGQVCLSATRPSGQMSHALLLLLLPRRLPFFLPMRLSSSSANVSTQSHQLKPLCSKCLVNSQQRQQTRPPPRTHHEEPCIACTHAAKNSQVRAL